MKLQRDSTDHMQNRMAKGAFITQGKGKKEALDQLLKPLHRQKLPIAFSEIVWGIIISFN